MHEQGRKGIALAREGARVGRAKLLLSRSCFQRRTAMQNEKCKMQKLKWKRRPKAERWSTLTRRGEPGILGI